MSRAGAICLAAVCFGIGALDFIELYAPVPPLVDFVATVGIFILFVSAAVTIIRDDWKE
jgi:hypothetical protein